MDRLAESIRFDRGNAAVVVVDVQNDFCHPEGRALRGRSEEDSARIQAVLRRLESFIDVARDHDVPVIFVRTTHSSRVDSPEWLARHLDPDRPPSCVEDSWGAEFCAVEPQSDDHVVLKHRYSAFAGTSLQFLLSELERRSLMFVGFGTNTCVESSLREAVSRDYLTTLVQDCCGAYTDRAHERAIESISSGFGLVTTSDRIARAWQAAAVGAAHG